MFKPHMTYENNGFVIASCESSCSQGYTFLVSNMKIEEEGFYKEWFLGDIDYSNQNFIPDCFPCPVGTSCDPSNTPNSLENYWGYTNQSSYVTMIRCPADYCCTGNDTCEGIDSCNTGRTGALCGTCQSNLTESLFSTKCLSFENCNCSDVFPLQCGLFLNATRQ